MQVCLYNKLGYYLSEIKDEKSFKAAAIQIDKSLVAAVGVKMRL